MPSPLRFRYPAPSALRRRAIGHLSLQEDQADSVVFPHCQGTRLRVTLESRDADTGSLKTGHNTWPATHADDEEITPLEHAIRAAQQEIVEHEIFTVLVREAGLLPTASARVSEQLIAFEVTPGTELRFELVRILIKLSH
jgi:mediator of RNA polymerase II transcription subunit 17